MVDPSSGKQCDHPVCTQAGEYRAPCSRTCDRYYWFCLDHVRDYNQSWDFYKGMTATEVESHLRDDVVWRRPTWPLGTQSHRRLLSGLVCNQFELLGHLLGNATSNRQVMIETPEARAMRIMELRYPVTRVEIKTRYKKLVKRFHPDTHGGDKTTEGKLKTVIEAYKTLMSSSNA